MGPAFASPTPIFSLRPSLAAKRTTMCANTTTKDAPAVGAAAAAGSEASVLRVAAFGERLPFETRPPRVHNPKKRVRQHLNPLAARWQGSVQVDEKWYAEAYADPQLPLFVDVGCGKGRFVESMAARDPDRNYLGLEIRSPLVDTANARAKAVGAKNVHFLACNANVSLGDVLKAAPGGVLVEVAAQFADPWFKKRHAKRRMVDAPLVNAVHDALRAVGRPGAALVVQTDVRQLAVIMRAITDAHRGLRRDAEQQWTADGWLAESPYDVQTEREICVLRKGGSVYRTRYTLVDGDEWSIDGVWDEEALALAVGDVSRLEMSDKEGE